MKFLTSLIENAWLGDAKRRIPGSEMVKGIGPQEVDNALARREEGLASAAREYLLHPTDLHALLNPHFPDIEFNPYELRTAEVWRQGNQAQEVARIRVPTPPYERPFTEVEFGMPSVKTVTVKPDAKRFSSQKNKRFVPNFVMTAEIPLIVTRFQTDKLFPSIDYPLRGKLISALIPFIRADQYTHRLEPVVRMQHAISWSQTTEQALKKYRADLGARAEIAQLLDIVRRQE